ncbi:MAG: GAF domain-containing protein, partial [Acidobacteriota bacterium]|nr:GAF domain-containing protein [Acidobacteriota bacterium]
MALLSNPGFLAVAYLECSAAFLLLVLYWLLLPGYSARFFRFWLAAWTVYAVVECVRIAALWRGGQDESSATTFIAPILAALILAAVLECAGYGAALRYLWSSIVMVESGLMALHWIAHLPRVVQWSSAILVSTVYIAAGWILWRSQFRHRGAGWKLLAATLLLRGLHGFDRPLWIHQELGLLRISFHGLLGVAMGGAMAVLVLEAGRSREEDLNERLRRLSLISAEAMQAPRSDGAFQAILGHAIECLGATHGLVLLLENPDRPGRFAVRGSVGFPESARDLTRVSPGEPWVERVLRSDHPIIVQEATDDGTLRPWLRSERLSTMLLVRISGKDAPLGILAAGSSAPRTYQREEEQYAVNVANLLGLAVQNLTLMTSVSSSHRQWEDTFDSIEDLILVHDSDGKIISVNRAFAARLQAQPHDLAERAIREVLRQGNHPWNRCPYCEHAAGEAEKFDPSFSGYYVSTHSALHDSDGKRHGTIHVLRDVTTRREAENKFHTLFEKVQEGVF